MIGVVGGGGTGARLADAIRNAGGTVEAGEPDRVIDADPAVVVAAGEAAVAELVSAGLDAPVLVVDAEPGVPSVGTDEVAPAVERLASGDFGTRDHRLLRVAADGASVGPAAFDVMLVRAEPGRISEFGVSADDARSQFRADGVVVATPLGSHGYARAVGGPRLSLDTAAVAVVPVAAFGLGGPTWVVDPADGFQLSVERDEGEVSLLVDGRERQRFPGRATVELSPAGTLTTVTLDTG